MSTTHLTGLGEPEPFGKRSLFQPSRITSTQNLEETKNTAKPKYKEISAHKEKVFSEERIHMGLSITRKSLAIIQQCQGRYRLENGHMLPKWKIISDALELYAQSKAGVGNEHTK